MSSSEAYFVGGAGGMALVSGTINHPTTPVMALQPSVLVGVGIVLFIVAFAWNAAQTSDPSEVSIE